MSMMCGFSMNANAMDNIPLKTTSAIPDDPDTPFIEQDVHDKLWEIFGDANDLDFYWNTMPNNVCKYAYAVEINENQIIVYQLYCNKTSLVIASMIK